MISLQKSVISKHFNLVYVIIFIVLVGCKKNLLSNEEATIRTDLINSNSYKLSHIDSILQFGILDVNTKENQKKGVSLTFRGSIYYKNIDTIDVIIKPNIGLSETTVRESIPYFRDNYSAQAAYELNKFINLVDMPEHVIRHDLTFVYEDEERKNIIAGVQVYQTKVSHLGSIKELRKLLINESSLDELEEIAVFDCLIGNKDRHLNNFFIRNKPVKGERSFVAIDHTLAFPMRNGKILKGNDGSSILISEYINSYRKGFVSDKNLNKIRKLSNNWNTIKEILILNLEYSAVDAIKERAFQILATRVVFDPTKLH